MHNKDFGPQARVDLAFITSMTCKMSEPSMRAVGRSYLNDQISFIALNDI